MSTRLMLNMLGGSVFKNPCSDKNLSYNGSKKGKTIPDIFTLPSEKKKRRQQINRIKNSKGKWIWRDEKIAKKAVRHFQTIFNLIPPMINNFK